MDTVADFGFETGRLRSLSVQTETETFKDASLVEAARGGDRAAFGELYGLYRRLVHGILLARVPPGEVADLAQDVFLSAYRQLHILRDAAAFGGWLAMIARNRANDYHRHFRETVELPEDSGREALAGQDAPLAEAREILAVLETLPEVYRETLILRLVEGMTGPEIAERTGLKPASVRVNLHRGMKQLRDKLERREAHA